MRVLVCGHRSFAAVGLVQQLCAAGHDVTAFSRGGATTESPGSSPDRLLVVGGAALELDQNPQLNGPFDVVVNYILLKDEPLAANVEYVAALLRLCQRARIGHLIHISSISSYQAKLRVVTEDAPIETVPERKGSYGSLKVATDQYLLAHRPTDLKLTLVRPGFILGSGVPNPIIGTATRLPWGKVLVIGAARSIIPMTTRSLVNRAVVRLIADPPAAPTEVVLLAAANSPTRARFLETCCRRLGIGTGVRRLPPSLWWLIAVGAEAALRMLGQGKLKPYSKLTARTTRQRFDSARSERRLGFDLSCDWEEALVESIERQAPNFQVPPPPPPLKGLAATVASVTFLGFGRIVKQKHLPGLKKAGFAGELHAYDVRPVAAAAPGEVEVRQVEGAALPPTSLYVVASPGPAHVLALAPLAGAPGAVLVEKPLCYRTSELEQWLAFAAGREAPTYVCHNYRLKQNVLRMMQHLRDWNPGRLDHVCLEFQSPSAANDSAPWLRDERRARTLLMDYAIHFIDVACMLGNGPWQVLDVRHQLDGSGRTGSITARLLGTYTVDLHLRQSFAPRRARLRFGFQNYVASLAFFPDTFVAHHADDNPWLHRAEASDSRRQTIRKVVDKLTGRESDASHALTLAMAGSAGRDAASRDAMRALEVRQLEPFYRAVLQMADLVYA
jgi:nucleoside-diphosphate-sugar epimerase/predicted dehydrogenase